MKRDWKYILYLSIAFGLFLAVKLTGPRDYDWTPTYAAEDKNPFGAYVLNQLIPSLFPGKKMTLSNQTLYELKDSVNQNENVVVIAHFLSANQEDTEVLLKLAENGAAIFISSQTIYGKLADTLKLATSDYLFEKSMSEQSRDSSYLRFVNPQLDSGHHYLFRRANIHNYFVKLDTSRTTVIAENDFRQPVTIRIRWGKGFFIFNCTPLAFTNIYALRGDNNQFIATSLSYLPIRDVCWTEYYSVGRMEARTPLRFILTHEPLAWAYYIAVISLLLFMLFEAKRKQRIIPIIPPLENTSLEFVGTIGNLYYQRGDHKNISEKKILYFFDLVRNRFMLNPAAPGENFITLLARKSGRADDEVRHLFQVIDSTRRRSSVSEKELIELNNVIEKFVSI